MKKNKLSDLILELADEISSFSNSFGYQVEEGNLKILIKTKFSYFDCQLSWDSPIFALCLELIRAENLGSQTLDKK